MKRNFLIEIEIPGEVSISEIKQYITTAVMFSTENLSLDDPLYQLDKSSVKVHTATRAKLADLITEMNGKVQEPS